MAPFLSTPSPAFIICRLFDGGHSDQCEGIPLCHFDLHFSNNEWCWASFHVKSIGTGTTLGDANILPLASPQWLHGAKPAWSKVSVWNVFKMPSLRCSDEKVNMEAFMTVTYKHQQTQGEARLGKIQQLKLSNCMVAKRDDSWKAGRTDSKGNNMVLFFSSNWQKFFQLHLKKKCCYTVDVERSLQVWVIEINKDVLMRQ